MPDADLRAARRARLAEICTQHGVEILYAFGSRSKEVYAWLEGELTELPPSSSDVDIGAYRSGGEAIHWNELNTITMGLEDFLGVSKVDLVSLGNARLYLALEVIRGERLYARDERQADEYDLRILRMAGDALPMHEERIDLLLGRVK